MTKYPLPPLGLAQPQCHNIDRIITVTYRRKGVTGSASISVKKAVSFDRDFGTCLAVPYK
jgi:hypothetical protein